MEYPTMTGSDIAAFVAEMDSNNDPQFFEVWQKANVRSAYLAGPMRGYEDFNYPLFNAVTAWLREQDYVIYNPAESDGDPGISDRALAHKAKGGNPLDIYMQQDLVDVARSDAVFVLPGWEASEGATIETTVAWLLGHPVYSLPTFEKIEQFGAKKPVGDQTMPADSADRKATPVVTGVIDYFPAALAEVARVSKYGNDKHNPGEPLHWSRFKSADHADAIGRHLFDRGKIDPETGMSHSAELAWRALAMLQIELEESGQAPLSRGSSIE